MLGSSSKPLTSKINRLAQLPRSFAVALPVTVIAKDYGMSAKAFNNLLHEMNIQFKSGKTWVLYQLYAGLGYVKSVTTVAGNGFVATINYWTRKDACSSTTF